MYFIFTYIWLKSRVNVGTYSIHEHLGYDSPIINQRVLLEIWRLLSSFGNGWPWSQCIGRRMHQRFQWEALKCKLAPGILNNTFLMDVWWNNHFPLIIPLKQPLKKNNARIQLSIYKGRTVKAVKSQALHQSSAERIRCEPNTFLQRPIKPTERLSASDSFGKAVFTFFTIHVLSRIHVQNLTCMNQRKHRNTFDPLGIKFRGCLAQTFVLNFVSYKNPPVFYPQTARYMLHLSSNPWNFKV